MNSKKGLIQRLHGFQTILVLIPILASSIDPMFYSEIDARLKGAKFRPSIFEKVDNTPTVTFHAYFGSNLEMLLVAHILHDKGEKEVF